MFVQIGNRTRGDCGHRWYDGEADSLMLGLGRIEIHPAGDVGGALAASDRMGLKGLT
jgi:hypothetical protein